MGIPMGNGYGIDMGTVMNPYGPVGIVWGFRMYVRLSRNALNMR